MMLSNQISKTPYCKVCHDAGKTDYSSHWLKDKTGKIVCPILLKTECRYCHKMGHTVKYCKVILASSNPTPKLTLVSKEKKATAKVVPVNSFSVLEDADADEDEYEYHEKEIKEELIQQTKKNVEILTNWVAIAAQPPKVKLPVPKKIAPVPVVKPAPWSKAHENLARIYSRSWADWSDDEDDDDEYEEDTYKIEDNYAEYEDEYEDDAQTEISELSFYSK
jgi:hypothetical protein